MNWSRVSRVTIGLGGLLLALVVCFVPARAADDARLVSLPLGAELFYGHHHFLPYGMNPRAILIDQQVYRYPYGAGERLFWVYRVTNLIRVDERNTPNRVVAFQLGVPPGNANLRDAMPEGWVSGPEALADIEWQAAAGTDAVVFPGYSAEFAFATERCNLAQGSGRLRLQGSSPDDIIDIDAPGALDVPGELLSPASVDCCMMWRGGHACGGASSDSECVNRYGGTPGCANCGTSMVACCMENLACGQDTEESCALGGGVAMGSCSSCQMNMVSCCTGGTNCGQMTEVGCSMIGGFPVGSCSGCTMQTTVNCCHGDGSCEETVAGRCGGTVVGDCQSCGWVPSLSRTWGAVKTLYR
jgi:hypothetical protein